MVRLSNDVSQIVQRPNLVAMATKFETKQAITNITLLVDPLASRRGEGYQGPTIAVRKILQRQTPLLW